MPNSSTTTPIIRKQTAPADKTGLELSNISALVEIADTVQEGFPDDDTLFHIASALYISLERFESALRTDDAPTRAQVYGFAFDSFHLANALSRLLIPRSDDFLESLLPQLQRIMEIHESNYVGVSA